MSTQPSISVVMPAYNAAGSIGAALDSIRDQDIAPTEVIVVDDGSTDDTAELVRAHAPGCRLLSQKVNRGPAAARNRGVAEANCEWVAFLDADDAWLPHKSAIQSEMLRQRPEVDLWCGTVLREAEPRQRGGPVQTRDIVLDDLVLCNSIVTSTVLVRKSVFDEVAGFDEQFCGPEDFDLWLRIVARHSAVKIESPLCRYSERHGSLSMDETSFLPQILAVLDKAYSESGCLHGRSGRRRAEAVRYLSASWTASSKGFQLRAVRWFFCSLMRWPLSIGGLPGHRWMRTKLVVAISRALLADARAVLTLPDVSIDLMLRETYGNDPFFARAVLGFYEYATARHPKCPLVMKLTRGVALCPLPGDYSAYFKAIEGSARRNCRKATRLGYRFERIDYNKYLDDIAEIRASSRVRQGALPASLISGKVKPNTDPESMSNYHDYPYFGILRENALVAYAGCLVAGELCMLQHILGHARHQADGIVPLLITGIAEHIFSEYPQVRYYAYGTFFGAGTTMRRFKRKFGFVPHRVKWVLGGENREWEWLK